MIEADVEWIEKATEALPSVYDVWHGREVVVMSGPLAGWHGVAGGPYKGNLEVLFPTTMGIERIWLALSTLSLVKANQSES